MGRTTTSILISDTESRLKALCIKEIKGIMILSHVQWIEEGERPSQYFFNPQKIKAQRSQTSPSQRGSKKRTLIFIRSSFLKSQLTQLCR